MHITSARELVRTGRAVHLIFLRGPEVIACRSVVVIVATQPVYVAREGGVPVKARVTAANAAFGAGGVPGPDEQSPLAGDDYDATKVP